MTALICTADEIPAGKSPVFMSICRKDGLKSLKSDISKAQKAYLEAMEFAAKPGEWLAIPDTNGQIERIICGAGQASFENAEVLIGQLAAELTPGYYALKDWPKDWQMPLMALFWGLGQYAFDKYTKKQKGKRVLVVDDEALKHEALRTIHAVNMGRDLINTPAGDMGPVALQDAAEHVAKTFGAKLKATIGSELLSENLPLIHAVGRAGHQPPRLVELIWGKKDHPSLALVGKGITFDTGGLDIKSAAGMRIMKKDMGGAAHALVLAQMIMAAKLPIRLHVYLAIAENAISAPAYRPGDVLRARNGKTVEIDNTDAEGRLVLADALTKASEERPDLIIDFATLTGAARVALGPTLPPYFSNIEGPVEKILQAGNDALDPLWRMPLFAPYFSMLSSPIADMKNAGGSFAGCVTAALFLEKFVGLKNGPQNWMHFDVYGWNPNPSPSKPKGGEIFAVRALFDWLKADGLSAL